MTLADAGQTSVMPGGRRLGDAHQIHQVEGGVRIEAFDVAAQRPEQHVPDLVAVAVNRAL
ncbi:hypothetical protein ACTMSW_09615 [Micromonospora sp. BQ11]|uniref:hypothetical protein n=1 Tax=Micromonospora sp. BQ11 TaxID=3452212 RepID=UPI003F8B0E43